MNYEAIEQERTKTRSSDLNMGEILTKETGFRLGEALVLLNFTTEEVKETHFWISFTS